MYIEHENEILRRRIAEYVTNEEIYRKNALEYEHKINELNEQHESKLFQCHLEYEKKIEQLTHQISEQQMEMLTLKQMYETLLNDKRHVDEQVKDIQLNEQSNLEIFWRQQPHHIHLRSLHR